MVLRYRDKVAFRDRPRLWFAILALAPVALRLALLRGHPVPAPDIYDEFGHLFVADTLRHFRLANPPNALPRFFETFFILQTPTFSSIYPIGQGLALAVGAALFGTPWAGVLLSTSLFCGLCYWALRGWTTPGWAAVGGALAVFEFGPLCQWTNTYYGGGLAALAGCLVFGALPRLSGRKSLLAGAALGAGLALHLLTRPWETLFLGLSVMLWGRLPWRPALLGGLMVLAALGVTLVHNRQVTGDALTLPYSLSRYQYGVPASLTLQAKPVPHHPLTREQELDYRMQRGFGPDRETLATYFGRLGSRARFLRFYVYPPLFVALLVFAAGIRTWRHLWIVLTLLVFALGTGFYPFFQMHYVAALAPLWILAGVLGLEALARLPGGRSAARALVILCAAQFTFWYGAHWLEAYPAVVELERYETADSINHRNPERRIEIARQLDRIEGRLLVFVRYWPQHLFQQEWVYNEAEPATARVVWARDLGGAEDEKLIARFPGRTVLTLEPDARPPRLSPWQPEPQPVAAPAPKAPVPNAPDRVPKLQLEQVR